MRQLRALLVVLVVGSGLGWGISVPVVSGAAPGAGLAAPAASATIQVTVEGDQNDDSSDPASAGSGCSLREALNLLFSNGDQGCGPTSPAATNVTIKMPAGDYVLSIPDALPPIADGRIVTIAGPGSGPAGCPAGVLTIDGGSQGGRHDGIFHIVNGTLNLQNLTLQHGSRPGGGAIWLGSGAVIADNVCFDSNDAAADPTLNGFGGAILDDTGDLTVTNSIFKNNRAFDSGGAVSTNFGYFYKDTFVGNKATAGGAFQTRSPTSFPVFIVQSQFKQNLARPQKPDQMPMSGYTTHGDSFGGGAIQNNGNLQLTQDLIQGNSTELMKGGGGFSNEAAGNAQLLETVVTGNSASARGGGDSNSFIDYAWGGGIYNAGVLQLVRASVHGNKADNAGAIFNHLPGNLSLFNTTVSNNTAKYLWGGLVNENAQFDPAISQGAEIHLTHATIGQNNSSSTDPADNDLSALYSMSVWFGNSILDAGCNVPQYTVGRSVMTGDCVTVADPNVSLFPGADISNTSQIQLGLQPLSAGSSTVPMFMVQKIDGNSIAALMGRDDSFGCGNVYILHKDQNQAPRPANQCSAGAFQAAAVPAQFSSAPGPGSVIKFPLIDFTLGQSGSLANLVLHNMGGGALTYQVLEQVDNPAIVNDSMSTSQGTLFKNQQATLTFACHPSEPGEYWHTVTVQTDAPNQAQAVYYFQCDAVGEMGLPSMMQMPGPYNMPMPPPASTAHAGFDMTNPGHMPLTTTSHLAMMGPPYGLMLSGPAGQAPSSPATTLGPGQSLHVDVACTPTGPGVFPNTLIFNTSDPANPVIQYDLACEGQVPSPPEALNPVTPYNTGTPMEGVAISPDGSEVLAGDYNDDHLQAYSRDPASGQLSSIGFTNVSGMSQIYGIQYSHDGKNAYYTSQAANGIVGVTRPGFFAVTDVITSGTPDNICIIAHTPIFCPIGTMVGARGLAISPDDQYVYVTGYSDGSLTVFQRDLNTGHLSYTQSITRTIGGVNVLGGAARVITSPDGAYIYVAAMIDNTVAVFQRTPSGLLNFQAAYPYSSSPGGLNYLHTPTDLAMSPDGQFVYVAASLSNAINVFSRSSADGGLSFSSVITGSIGGTWGVAVSGDDAGKRVFLASYSSGVVQVDGRNQATGALSFVGGYSTSGPVFAVVSPDNQDVYVSLYDGQGVQLFQTIENAPVLTHISPASAVVGGAAFTLTVGGGRFYPNSQVLWAGAPLATVFVNQRELQAAVPAGLINALGTPQVKVRNPAPGGGDSTTLSFAITAPAQAPVPSIASLDPPAASFGGGDLVVLVHGANFAPSAQVYYNHAAVPTVFIDNTLLQITLSADILNTPGDGGLEVTNGGGAPALSAPNAPDTSNSSSVFSFKVNPPGVPAPPALASLSPASVVSGSAPIWLTVTGYNFSGDPHTLSVGRWNGLARPSVVIDAHSLLMNVTQADLAGVKNALVTVLTPGAGSSSALSFRVRAANEKPIPVVKGASLQAWTLYVHGSDFVAGAQVRVNGSGRATTFVNVYEVKATLLPSDHGMVITVTNPGPGGGPSNAVVAFFTHLFLPFLR